MGTEANAENLAKIVRRETKRRWEESMQRVEKSVGMLSEEEVWHKFNENALTVGNILLHLAGNVRQWIVGGIGGQDDHRKRDFEFLAYRTAEKAQLLDNLKKTLEEAHRVLDEIDSSQLVEIYKVQGTAETGLAILTHVTEHLSYHTGQITHSTKILKDIDTGYYDNKALSENNG